MGYIIAGIFLVIVAIVLIKQTKKAEKPQPNQKEPYNPGTGGGQRPDKNEPLNMN